MQKFGPSSGGGKTKRILYDEPAAVIPLAELVEAWTVDQVVLWMRGLDDGVLPFLDRISQSQIDGRGLFLVDCDDLERIGIRSYGVRKIIVQAIKVLYYFCYTIKSENLQILAMNVCLSAGEVVNDMKATKAQYEKLRNRATTRSDLTIVFNAITKTVSRINEDIKKLMFWLDRSPFDRKEKFIELRNKVTSIACEIVKCVNVPSRQLLQAPTILMEKADELGSLCQTIIDLEDPAILYTSFLKKATLKKTTSSEWGFNLQSSYRGVHVISEIKIQTPADQCGKIDAGDEILEVNGVTVVGWELSKLVQKIYDSPIEMVLLINKRPCEVVTNPFRTMGLYVSTDQKTVRLAPGSTLTRLGSTKPNPGNLTAKADFTFFSGNDFFEEMNKSPKWTRKTSSLTNLASVAEPGEGNQVGPTSPVDKKQPPLIHRRGSLFGDKARRGRMTTNENRRNGRVKFDDVVADFHVLYPPKLSFRRSIVKSGSKKRDSDSSGSSITIRQHASLDETRDSPSNDDSGVSNHEEDEDGPAQFPLIVRRTRRMRQQPDGYVKSFIDNRLVDEIEENAVLDSVEKSEGGEAAGEIQFATIDVVGDEELEKLGIPVPPTTPLSGGGFRSRLPSDWKAPIRELVTATAGFIGHRNPHHSLTSLESPMCLSSHSKVAQFFAEPLPSTASSPPPTPLKSPFAMTNSVISEDVSISSSTSRTRLERKAPLANTEETQNIDDWSANLTDDENTNRRVRSTVSAPPENNESRGLSLQELSLISCELLGGKCYEGWIRRMRLDSERDKSKKRKWVKCWMVLKASLLFIYQHQFSKEAEIVIAVVNFSVNDANDIKTSKKHVFKLHRGSTAFYFAATSSTDMKSWMNKLALASICYNQSDEERKSSDYMSKSILYINNNIDVAFSASPPTTSLHHTLPRANNVVSSGFRPRLSERQASLSSLHSARSALDSELLAALESSLERKRKDAEKRESTKKK